MQRKYIVLSLLALVLIGIGAYLYNQREAAAESLARVRNVVYNFGDELKLVPTLAPHAEFVTTMNKHYAMYVHPDLLNKWNAEPATAPGRVTSSPWPDRIDIDSMVKNKDGTYTVEAHIVQKASGQSSTTPALADIPIRLIITMGPDGFQITDYQTL
ncbi:MAG: hypothetical protein AAB472_02200 [Patescibacteria group bacterium]